MRKLLLLTFAILAAIHLTAQKPFKKNTIYGELGGNGIFLSLNYEKQMGIKPGLGLHIGVGICDVKPFIPIGATYMFDLGNKKSFIETGAGITLGERYAWDTHLVSQTAPKPYKPAFIPSIGYRHQTHYGLMWRVNYTPVFTKYRNVLLFLGISTGWRI
jgi:hypothetical protein